MTMNADVKPYVPSYPEGYEHPGFIWLSHREKLLYHPPLPFPPRITPLTNMDLRCSAGAVLHDCFDRMHMHFTHRLNEGFEMLMGLETE